MHPDRLLLNLTAAFASLLIGASPVMGGASLTNDLEPQTPAAFLPGGMLGIQLGGSWQRSKQNPSLHELNCQAVKDASDFDEVCFFKASAASRVGGAQIHDGFIVGKDGSGRSGRNRHQYKRCRRSVG